VLSRLLFLKAWFVAFITPLCYLILCGFVAALMAYPLYWASGGEIELRALMSRGSLILLALGLIPISKYLHLNRIELGIERFGPVLRRQALIGFAAGVFMLALHSLLLIALEIRVIDWNALHNPSRLLTSFFKALGIGVVVAIIEEILFRGVLWSILQRIAGWRAAILLSSFYYSALHFYRSDLKLNPESIHWSSGFEIMGNAASHLLAMEPDSFLALFLAGAFLACCRLLFPLGLGYCVGLHAGWVFVIKYSKTLTNGTPHGSWSFLVSSYDGMIGYLAAAWMGTLALLLFVIFQRSKPSRPTNAVESGS
jgi:membrane protease YdiL (CAAX protease family)